MHIWLDWDVLMPGDSMWLMWGSTMEVTSSAKLVQTPSVPSAHSSPVKKQGCCAALAANAFFASSVV